MRTRCLGPCIPPRPRPPRAQYPPNQVYDTPHRQVNRDNPETVAQLGDLRFRAVDTSGLEPFSPAASLQARAAALTLGVLRRADAALVIFDAK